MKEGIKNDGMNIDLFKDSDLVRKFPGIEFLLMEAYKKIFALTTYTLSFT